MSTIKRSRGRQPEAASLPASKRQKLANPKSGLAFLVDESARKDRKLDAKLTNGIPSTKATKVDESRTVVTAGPQKGDDTSIPESSEVIDISSGEQDDSELDDSEDEEDDRDNGAEEEEAEDKMADMNGSILPNGHAPDAMEEDPAEEAGAADDDLDEELGEPSFGDMLAARHPQPIDVQASFADPSTQRSALIPSGSERVLSAPSTTSLGTVLTQALKTNDRDLLESCFQVNDFDSVRATIQRLPSQHITTLLQRIAERIHKAPGRANVLMVWVQWSLVAHGGYLAGQPELLRKLRSLTQVVRERASGLDSLLHLKGKLEMLSAQLELRKSMLVSSRTANEQDDDEAVLYVEDDDGGSWSGNASLGKKSRSSAKQRKTRSTSDSEASGADDDSDDEADLVNGDAHDSEEEDDDEEDEEGLIDIEAEVDSDDDGEGDGASDDDEEASDIEEDEDEDDEISADDEDADDVAVKTPRPQTLTRKR